MASYGRGGGVARGLGVGAILGVGEGLGVKVGVAVAVGVEVGVAVGPVCAQYLAPVWVFWAPTSSPPQMIISLPLHIAV